MTIQEYIPNKLSIVNMTAKEYKKQCLKLGYRLQLSTTYGYQGSIFETSKRFVQTVYGRSEQEVAQKAYKVVLKEVKDE